LVTFQLPRLGDRDHHGFVTIISLQ
jgi:hypothetical protein